MMRNYHITALEDWVTNLYIRIHITHPKHIREDEIAQNLGIFHIGSLSLLTLK